MTDIEKLEKRIRQIEKENIGLTKNIGSRQKHFEMNKDLINNLKQQIEDLKAEDSVWKPRKDEDYYYYSDDEAIIGLDTNDNHIVDEIRYKLGNCFKTKEEAKKVKRHLITRAKLQRIADRLNKGREIDWEDVKQRKYYIYYNHLGKEIRMVSDFSTKTQGTIYCLDENFKDIAIQEIGEEELEEYLKGI